MRVPQLDFFTAAGSPRLARAPSGWSPHGGALGPPARLLVAYAPKKRKRRKRSREPTITAIRAGARQSTRSCRPDGA